MNEKDSMIPLKNCIDGHLYKILGRNGYFGMFMKGKGKKHFPGNNAFRLSRWKFSSNYLDQEFHWETGLPYGTAKPLEDMGPAPVLDDEDLKNFLNKLTDSLTEEEKNDMWGFNRKKYHGIE